MGARGKKPKKPKKPKRRKKRDMALNAATVWEIRTSGNNNNGGGYNAGGTDYSQQDAAQLSLSDVVTDGTTTVTSATGGFTAAMIGNIVNILTKGRFEIAGVTDTNTITVDRTATAGSGLSAYVGGAVAGLEEIDNVIVAGNVVHMKSGTHTPGTAILTTTGSATAGIEILGYNASRGDEPAGDNRPLIQMEGNALTISAYTAFKHFRVTTTHNYGLYLSSGGVLLNVKVYNSGVATRYAVRSSSGNRYVDCDLQSDNGIGIYNCDSNLFKNCYIHDSVIGFQTLGADNVLVNCIIANNSSIGLDLYHGTSFVLNCSIDGNGTGFYQRNYFNAILDNQITNNTTGFDANTDPARALYMDYNNWHGNTADIGNTTPKGAHATANDPGYANPGTDYSGVDDANGLGIRLGVG